MLNKIYRSDAFIITVLTTLSFVLIYFFKVNALIAGEKDLTTYHGIWNHIILKASFHETLSHPWTLLSYQFYSEDYIVLLTDLFWLWVFGSVIAKQKGERSMLVLYLTGGILGGLCFISFPKPELHYFLGMPSGLVAVSLAAFFCDPSYSFQVYKIRIPVALLTVFFLLVKLLTVKSFSWHYISLLFGGVIAALLFHYIIPSIFQKISRNLLRLEEVFSNKQFVGSNQ